MGKLIVLEGLDGSGKSTQTELAVEFLKNEGVDFRKIKLPDYESPSSTLVKMYLSGDFGKDADCVNAYAAGTFYAADRYASFNLDWKRDYEGGRLIIADRYATSNLIYQMEKLDVSEWDGYIAWCEDFEYGKLELPRPDLVIFLDMPVEISQRLMSERYGGDESEKDVHESDVEFLKNCRKAALYAAEKAGWRVVPCSDGEAPYSIEHIQNRITELIKEVLC